MTKEELKTVLLASLGSGRVDVELDPAHVDAAIFMTLLNFSLYAPVKQNIYLTSEDGQTKFDLSFLPKDTVLIDVKKTKTQTAFILDPPSYDTLIENRGYDIVDVAIIQNYINTVNKTLGREFQWRFEYPFLYLNKPLSSGEIIQVDYIKPYQAVDEVPVKYLPAFIKYAKAELKEILGRIRGKYKGMPGPEGSIEMDYSELLSEAQAEKEEAIEQVKRLSQTGFFIVG